MCFRLLYGQKYGLIKRIIHGIWNFACTADEGILFNASYFQTSCKTLRFQNSFHNNWSTIAYLCVVKEIIWQMITMVHYFARIIQDVEMFEHSHQNYSPQTTHICQSCIWTSKQPGGDHLVKHLHTIIKKAKNFLFHWLDIPTLWWLSGQAIMVQVHRVVCSSLNTAKLP